MKALANLIAGALLGAIFVAAITAAGYFFGFGFAQAMPEVVSVSIYEPMGRPVR